MYGIIIDNQDEPYVLAETDEWLTELVRLNREQGHDVLLVRENPLCPWCNQPVDGWYDVLEYPVHDGACLTEELEWKHADMMDD